MIYFQHSPSSFHDDNEDEDDDEIKSDDSTEIERKRKKAKKTKKKKNKKKKKRKRNRSISSVENISDNDSMLDDDLNLTPPIRTASPAQWDKRYTPNRTEVLSKSPSTPPIRPNSNISIYSDTGKTSIGNHPLRHRFSIKTTHIDIDHFFFYYLQNFKSAKIHCIIATYSTISAQKNNNSRIS